LELSRHHELAEFLRSRRARVSPEQVGLRGGTRRRTPGLRRGEVAQLAGVSPEWYTWLEQGRDIHVSVQLLESLARVFNLDANERAHLFLLALRQPPPVDTYTPPTISPALQRFLDQLGLTPACAVDARLNVLACNAPFRLIFGDYPNASEQNQNLIWRLFTKPHTSHSAEWEELLRIYVAQFRAEYGRFINDPWWAKQIDDLSQISPKFRELWARHDVLNVTEGWKKLHHPVEGELIFDFLIVQTVDASGLRLLIHTPRTGSGTAEKIERLLAAEAQSKTPQLACIPA
jgi:transcriptional regulator with XRE-family HTH domain